MNRLELRASAPTAIGRSRPDTVGGAARCRPTGSASRRRAASTRRPATSRASSPCCPMPRRSVPSASRPRPSPPCSRRPRAAASRSASRSTPPPRATRTGVVVPGPRLVWHNGSNRGFRAILAAAPDSGDAFVVLTNSDRGLAMTDDLMCAWGRWLTGLETATCWVERKRRGTMVLVAGLAGLGVAMDGAAFARRLRRRRAMRAAPARRSGARRRATRCRSPPARPARALPSPARRLVDLLVHRPVRALARGHRALRSGVVAAAHLLLAHRGGHRLVPARRRVASRRRRAPRRHRSRRRGADGVPPPDHGLGRLPVVQAPGRRQRRALLQLRPRAPRHARLRSAAATA